MDDIAAAIADRILSGRSRLTGAIDVPVTGCSMMPALAPGQTLRIAPVAAADLRAGDVVVFARNGTMVAHRILGRSGAMLLTRGDARLAPDVPVAVAQVLGRAEQPIPVAPRPTARRLVATTIDQLCLAALRVHPMLAAIATRLLTRVERSSTTAPRPPGPATPRSSG